MVNHTNTQEIYSLSQQTKNKQKKYSSQSERRGKTRYTY